MGHRRRRDRVVAAVELDQREDRGVLAQPSFRGLDVRRVEPTAVNQGLLGPGGMSNEGGHAALCAAGATTLQPAKWISGDSLQRSGRTYCGAIRMLLKVLT